MAIGSGLGSQLGFSAETVYGTFVAPAKFTRAKAYMVDRVSSRQQGTGISTGQHGPLASQYVETTVGAAATLDFDVQNRGLGVLLNTLMGGSVTPAIQGAGPAYLAAFPIADTLGKSCTVQVGVPNRAGTVTAHSLSGGKITSAEFACAVDGLLTCSMSVDGKTFSKAESLATAAYTSTAVFHGAQMTLKMGTYASEAAVSGVRAVSVSINRPHDTGDFTAGNSGAKSVPVLNGLTEIVATVEADYLGTTQFQDFAHGTTATSFVWEFTGALLNDTHYDTFRITLPSVTVEPGTQGVSGVSELTNSWTMTWRYDGTNLPKIETISADTAL